MPTVSRTTLVDQLKNQQSATVEAIEALEAALVRDEALEELLKKKGAQIVTFRFRTIAKMNKTKRGDRTTPNPWMNADGDILVEHVYTVNGVIGCDYEKRLAKRLEAAGREDERKSHASWHEPILNEDGGLTALSQYKGDADRLYVRFFVTRFLNSHFEDVRTGAMIERADLEPFLKVKSDNPTGIMTPSIDGIEMLKVNGKTIEIGA